LIDPAQLWADPRLVYTVATLAVALLLATIWLFQRRRRHGRQAGTVCLALSILLHVALLFLVPMLPRFNGGSPSVDPHASDDAGIDSVSFSTFDPDMDFDDTAGESEISAITPLPVSELLDLAFQPIDEPHEAVEEDLPREAPTPEIPSMLAAQ
jgi:hypothetical protein